MRINTILRSSVVAALAYVVASTAIAASPEPASNDPVQKPQRFRKELRRSVVTRYLLHLPRGYRQKSKTEWPLILFLHGAGERGTNLNAVKVHGPPKIVATKSDFPCIVVSPQCPNGQHWDNDSLLALLDHVIARYRVNPRRVYLTGLSMGGFGTWSLGTEHPERFAALVPICGGGETIGILLADGTKREALRTLPVWAFHGAKDSVVNVAESERMVEALRRIGAKPKFTVYPNADHDSWTQTYDNPELYAWLFQQSRATVPED